MAINQTRSADSGNALISLNQPHYMGTAFQPSAVLQDWFEINVQNTIRNGRNVEAGIPMSLLPVPAGHLLTT